MKRILFLCLLISMLAMTGAYAQVPQTFSYQGVLKDDADVLVPDDNYDLTFRIYNDKTSGTALWTEYQTIYVSGGILNAVLGAVTPIALDFTEQYWLGVTIGTGDELSPRTQLTGVPYALNAQAVLGTYNEFPDSGFIGIGTTDPDYPVHIVSDELRGLRIDGTRPGSWSLLSINASGSALSPGIEFLRGDIYKARTNLDSYDDWHFVLGTTDVLTFDGATNNVGVGTTGPVEKLDVNGAVKLGTTDSTHAGTIRWTGADFEGYDGGTWLSLTAGGGGSLPPGSLGQTIRHNGSGWVASSLIYNDGSKVGVGTTSPIANMEVIGDNIGYHFRLTAPTGAGPALYLNAANKDWVIYGTNPTAGAGDRKFVIRDYSAATDRLVIDENGYVGINEQYPDAPLHIEGGNWDLNGTDGDLKIGDDNYRLKIGVATGGLGAGTVGMRVQGGNEKLVLGAGLAEVLWIKNTGTVTIGSVDQNGQLELYRSGVPTPMMYAYTNNYGGKLHVNDEDGYTHTMVSADLDGTGGYFLVMRDSTHSAFTVDGNWAGTGEPRASVNGSTQYAGFYLDLTGTSAVQLPNGSIDRSEIADEPGCASNNAWDASGPALSGPAINVLTSRTITVPSSGYVLAIATVQVDVHHSSDSTSYAFFGVSDDSTAFPVCQDVMLELSQNLPWGDYTFPVTNHSLFDVAGAGTYTFYQLAQEHSGNFQIFDSQLSLVYIPTQYGTVSGTMAGTGVVKEGGTAPLQSSADVFAERLASISANEARIERELAEMRSQFEQLKREMEMEKQSNR